MFENRPEEELWVREYLLAPGKIQTTKDAVWRGSMAARGIAECEEMIAKLKSYQTMLYERVQEIEQAPYHSELELVRDKSWSTKKVSYTLRLLRVYDVPGIDDLEEEKAVYSGTERHQALKDFEAMKKARPGIVARLNIEKSRWEK